MRPSNIAIRSFLAVSIFAIVAILFATIKAVLEMPSWTTFIGAFIAGLTAYIVVRYMEDSLDVQEEEREG